MKGISQAVASNLRTLRAERGMSVSDLARQSGVAKGTISKLETGASTNPTVETLWALADALGANLSHLVVTDLPVSQVTRAADAVWVDGEMLRARVLDRLSNRQVHDVAQVDFVANRCRHAGPHASGALAHVLVLKGRLRVGPEEATIELADGDYACFAADRPHIYEARRARASALVIMSMPRAPFSEPDGYVNGSLLAPVRPASSVSTGIESPSSA